MNIWALDQVIYFLTASTNIKRLTRCYIAFAMSLLTGMRQGEIMGLRWKDIDFERNIIYIKQTLTQAAEIKSVQKRIKCTINSHTRQTRQ